MAAILEAEKGFRHLSIECDGKHTRILVDGVDVSKGTTKIEFIHIANCKSPYNDDIRLSLVRDITVKPDL